MLQRRDHPFDQIRRDHLVRLRAELDRNDFVLLDEVALQIGQSLDLRFEDHWIDHPFGAEAAVPVLKQTGRFAFPHSLELGFADRFAQVPGSTMLVYAWLRMVSAFLP